MFIDVSGKPIGLIFMGQAILNCMASRKSDSLKYIAAEDWNPQFLPCFSHLLSEFGEMGHCILHIMRSNSREFRENRARKDRTLWTYVHESTRTSLTRTHTPFWTVKNAFVVSILRHDRNHMYFFLILAGNIFLISGRHNNHCSLIVVCLLMWHTNPP